MIVEHVSQHALQMLLKKKVLMDFSAVVLEKQKANIHQLEQKADMTTVQFVQIFAQ